MTIAPTAAGGSGPAGIPAPYAVRPATRDDLAAINAIFNHSVLHSTASYQQEAETMEQRESWFLAHGQVHPVLVAEAAGEVIGWAALSRYHPRAAYLHTVEDSVYVRADHHHRGVGRALLTRLQGLGRDLGHHTIIALISADQLPSIALHQSCGFVQAGQLREVGNKFSQWLDVVFMQYLFK